MPSLSSPSKRKLGTPKTPPSSKRIRSADPKVFGHIAGVEVGAWWATREDCSIAAVHTPWVAGISGGKVDGAYSIALSGGYEDDEDLGYIFTYTGAGGRDLKGTPEKPKNLRIAPQSQDQSFTHRQNAALKTSEETGRPIRVVRGYKLNSLYAPNSGYRYDGLYTIEKSWMERGKEGFQVCRYKFQRLGEQPPLPGTELPDDLKDHRTSDMKPKVVRKSEVKDVQMTNEAGIKNPGNNIGTGSGGNQFPVKQEVDDDVFLVNPEVDTSAQLIVESAESKFGIFDRSAMANSEQVEWSHEVKPHFKCEVDGSRLFSVKTEVNDDMTLVKSEMGNHNEYKYEVRTERKPVVDNRQQSVGDLISSTDLMEVKAGENELDKEVETKLASDVSEGGGDRRGVDDDRFVKVGAGSRNLETALKEERKAADLEDSEVRGGFDKRLLVAEIRPAVDRAATPNVKVDSKRRIEATIMVDDRSDVTRTPNTAGNDVKTDKVVVK